MIRYEKYSFAVICAVIAAGVHGGLHIAVTNADDPCSSYGLPDGWEPGEGELPGCAPATDDDYESELIEKSGVIAYRVWRGGAPQCFDHWGSFHNDHRDGYMGVVGYASPATFVLSGAGWRITANHNPNRAGRTRAEITMMPSDDPRQYLQFRRLGYETICVESATDTSPDESWNLWLVPGIAVPAAMGGSSD